MRIMLTTWGVCWLLLGGFVTHGHPLSGPAKDITAGIFFIAAALHPKDKP